jgi:hypothetical protein
MIRAVLALAVRNGISLKDALDLPFATLRELVETWNELDKLKAMREFYTHRVASNTEQIQKIYE